LQAKKRLPVAKPATSPVRHALSRERIVAAALALVERDGLEALSTRRLGQDLGCEAMSIYYHFPSKTHLLDALVDHAIGGAFVAPPHADWVERLRQTAYGYRAMALKYSRLFPLIALHRLNTATGVTYLNEVIGIFRAAGFDDKTAAQLFRETGYYLVGAMLDETAGYAKGPSAVEPVTDADIAREQPHLAAVAPFFKPGFFESTFAGGLEIMLAAMQRLRRRRDSTFEP